MSESQEVLSLRRERDLLVQSLDEKDRLINLLENRLSTLEKLSKLSSVPSSSRETLSVLDPSEKRHVVQSDSFREKLKAMDFGEAAMLYAKHGTAVKSYRDQMELSGKQLAYNVNPIGKLKDGTIVEINKKATIPNARII